MAVLEKQLARLQAVDEIRKLMGRCLSPLLARSRNLTAEVRHTVNHNAKNMAKTLSFFALDEPNVSVEVGDRGVYVGRAAIETLFKDQYGSASVKGNLLFPFLTTEMIEVAQDGMSARVMPAVCSAHPSSLTLNMKRAHGGHHPCKCTCPQTNRASRNPSGSLDPTQAGNFTLSLGYCLTEAAVDFLHTAEGWKILHFHWYRTIKVSNSCIA